MVVEFYDAGGVSQAIRKAVFSLDDSGDKEL
jgi:hypothetical protein